MWTCTCVHACAFTCICKNFSFRINGEKKQPWAFTAYLASSKHWYSSEFQNNFIFEKHSIQNITEKCKHALYTLNLVTTNFHPLEQTDHSMNLDRITIAFQWSLIGNHRHFLSPACSSGVVYNPSFPAFLMYGTEMNYSL